MQDYLPAIHLVFAKKFFLPPRPRRKRRGNGTKAIPPLFRLYGPVRTLSAAIAAVVIAVAAAAAAAPAPTGEQDQNENDDPQAAIAAAAVIAAPHIEYLLIII